MQPQPTTAAANTSTLQSMQALPEAALRQTVLGERLTHHHPADASALIHHILHGATSGDPASRTAAVALAQWILAEPERIGALWRWMREEVTYNHGHATAAALIAGVDAFQTMANEQSKVLFKRLYVRTSLDPEQEKLRIP